MKINQELLDTVGVFFKNDIGMNFFAPGYVKATEAESELVPWAGLQNLNRCVYFAVTFYFYFYNEMIADVSIGFVKDKNEPIIVEIKDNFLEILKEHKKGLLMSKVEDSDFKKTLLIKEIFEFASTKLNKFNELFENDPNIKKLKKLKSTISQPLILTDKEVSDYYAKIVKIIFNR